MGKLVIKFQGKLIGEVNLKLGDTKIGRKVGCDIVLNDNAISGEHAVVKTVGMKSSIQDLGSTNGTFIENKRVQQHELKHGESVIIGGHTLIYRDDLNLDVPVLGKQPAPAVPPPAPQEKTTVMMSFGQLLVIDGKDKGKRLPLVKEEVVIDNPGKGPARIIRTSEGYVLQAGIGPGEPRLNDRPVPPGGQLLEKGDVIEVAGAKFQFFG
ncbi:MAG: FHA domain-containing protein [Gammaproteobacteria bacterium]|nr:FHA domain-containing protein [Gammaproteobacteria bacterium]